MTKLAISCNTGRCFTLNRNIKPNDLTASQKYHYNMCLTDFRRDAFAERKAIYYAYIDSVMHAFLADCNFNNIVLVFIEKILNNIVEDLWLDSDRVPLPKEINLEFAAGAVVINGQVVNTPATHVLTWDIDAILDQGLAV